MDSFIPGPWTKTEGLLKVLDPGGGIVTEAHVRGTWAESEANARLIAAAPDLLEACQTVLAKLRSETESVTVLEQMALADAVAKAIGRNDQGSAQ